MSKKGLKLGTKNKKRSISMLENKNAEKWDLETATSFFNEVLELSYNSEYDYIGELAFSLKQDKGVFDYLTRKYPELKKYKNHILSNCEVNCFRNAKKGKINTAIGIVNLKSNHGWSDKVDKEKNVSKKTEIHFHYGKDQGHENQNDKS